MVMVPPRSAADAPAACRLFRPPVQIRIHILYPQAQGWRTGWCPRRAPRACRLQMPRKPASARESRARPSWNRCARHADAACLVGAGPTASRNLRWGIHGHAPGPERANWRHAGDPLEHLFGATWLSRHAEDIITAEKVTAEEGTWRALTFRDARRLPGLSRM